MTLQFQSPWLLLLLLLLIPLALLMHLMPRPSVTAASVKAFRTTKKRRRFTLLQWAVLLSLALTVIALSRPRIPRGDRTIRAKGVDIVLALDMSGSMDIFDRPRDMSETEFIRRLQQNQISGRLDTAKKEIAEFISKRPNDRIGLIGFADLAYSFIPPTLDHALLLERLKNLRTGELGNATGIASPIGTAVRRLKDSDSPRRVLVLFTDGANNVDNRVTPQEAAQIAKDHRIIIHTVGIGSDRAYAVVDTMFGRQLARQEHSLDENLLRSLAAATGGSYFPAADAGGMQQVMTGIDALERTSRESPRYTSYRELAPYPALAAAIILLLGMATEFAGKVRLP
ncbi:MAG: VWA domain-containing protein [Lentisphaeria bacterium]|nr:VWA domain-containing protein [Lentisphaeria bacterium]